MGQQLKQSTAANIPFFMVDSTDSITGKTGLSPTVTLSKNSAGFGSAGGSVTEIGNGWYNLAANTTDTATLGPLALHATATGADAWDESHQVLVDIPGGAVASVTGAVGSVTGAVGSVTGAVGSVTGAVGSVTGAVGSVTGNVGGNVVGTVASVVGAVGSVTAVVSANLTQILGTALTETAGQIAAAFKQFFNIASPTSTINLVTAVTTVTTTTTATNLTTNNDKTGYALSVAGVQAVWDKLTSALTTAGSIGKLIVDNLNSAISGILSTAHFDAIIGTPAGASIAADLVEIEGETDGIAAIPTATVLTAHFDTIIGTPVVSVSADIAEIEAETDGIAAIPTNPLLTTDARLNNLNATISSRLATASYTAPDNADIVAIKAITDQFSFTAGNVNANSIVVLAQVEMKKNVAVAAFTFPMVDLNGDPLTGIVPTVQRSIDGAALANCANAAVGIGGGLYSIDLATTDLNGGVVGFIFSGTGAKTAFLTVRTQA